MCWLNERNMRSRVSRVQRRRHDGGIFLFLFSFFPVSLHVRFSIISCVRRSFSVALGGRRKSSGRCTYTAALNLAAAVRRERRPPTGLHNSLLQLLVCDSFAGRPDEPWRATGLSGSRFSFSLSQRHATAKLRLAGQNRAAILGSALRAFEAPKAVTLTGRNRRERAIESICMKCRVSLIRREDKRIRFLEGVPSR